MKKYQWHVTQFRTVVEEPDRKQYTFNLKYSYKIFILQIIVNEIFFFIEKLMKLLKPKITRDTYFALSWKENQVQSNFNTHGGFYLFLPAAITVTEIARTSNYLNPYYLIDLANRGMLHTWASQYIKSNLSNRISFQDVNCIDFFDESQRKEKSIPGLQWTLNILKASPWLTEQVGLSSEDKIPP